MNNSIRNITIIVMVALTLIIGYQAYWLVGLYGTMSRKMHSDIMEAMRKADYEEIDTRIKKLRRQNDYKTTTFMLYYKKNKGWSEARKSLSLGSERIDEQEPMPTGGLEEALRTRNGVDSIGLFIQRALHSAVDGVSEVNVHEYDRCLTRQLKKIGIDKPHELLYIYRRKKELNSPIRQDTILTIGKPVRGPHETFNYSLEIVLPISYQLILPTTTTIVLRQMAGILITSLTIMLLLLFVFLYLIHVIREQKSLDEMKSDFTNNITHELKTPIAVAYAANDALLNFHMAQDPVKTEKYLKIGQDQLKKLSGLVEEILSMSMERRKTLRINKEDVALRPLVESLCAEQRLKEDKPMHVSIDIPEALTLHTDATHLRHILSNLLDNAVKYSVDKADIVVKAWKDAGGTNISVSDQGIGMTEREQRYIFDKFYRVPHGDRQDVKGYGLGLYFVKTMMERLGGTVTVKSAPGKGSTFNLHFNG
jgi:signal transduction histidine kinase